MNSVIKSVASATTLATFAFLALASGGKTEDVKRNGASTSTKAADPVAPPTTFDTIELARPTSEHVKFKIDVPVGTQMTPEGTRLVLTKGDRYKVEVTPKKEPTAERRATLASSDSGWTDIKVVKETPSVIVLQGFFLGAQRTLVQSSVAIDGFWITCNNSVMMKADAAAIDDMTRTCESLATRASAVPESKQKTAAATKSPKKSTAKKP